jgi:hypothetical protein
VLCSNHLNLFLEFGDLVVELINRANLVTHVGLSRVLDLLKIVL